MPGLRESHLVVIITDDANFARDLIGRWQMERTVPRLTAISSELAFAAAEGSFDLAVIGPVRNPVLSSLLNELEENAAPVICLLETAAQVQRARVEHPRALILQRQENWLDLLVLFARECLKRVDLTARLRAAEHAVASDSRHAALGRFILDSRHDFNNALTSVLGNAELLLMDETPGRDQVREQLQTIHEMGLHLHSIMQRFSSLALEMRSQNSSQCETEHPSQMTMTAS